MTDAVTGELRWFIGKITHCATNASDLAEFARWLDDVQIPDPCSVPAHTSDDHWHQAMHAAFEAISLLYPNDNRLAAMAHIRLSNAVEDLFSRDSTVEPAPGAPVPPEADEGDDLPEAAAMSPAGDAPSGAAADATVALEQSVSAGRDINAPIINATGGVTINDRSYELNKYLHDYLTYIIFISLGIKQPHATADVSTIVDEALTALTSYHQKTYTSVDGPSWGHYPELRRHAIHTWDSVDKACRAVLGLSLEDARLGLFETPFPEFDLFGNMVLVRGGYDPYTSCNVDPYYISRTPVNLAQYDEFCRILQYPRVPEWEGMSPPQNLSNHPVTGVSLFDTVMFCVWLETATGFRFRLPTESEWCFAATEGRRQAYPWGDEYRAGYASTSVESPQGTTPVDARPQGASASGVLDLIGNVWELTSTLYAEDPTAPDMDVAFPPMMFALARQAWWESDRRIPRGAGPWQEAARLVMRGGSWGGGPEWASMDRRIWTSMFNRGAYGGFRVVCSAQRIDNGYLPVPSYLAPRVALLADRIQLTNSDGSSAITQRDMSACGWGGTAEGEISAQLRDTALARYEGVGDKPFDRAALLFERATEVANPSTFPPLRPPGTFRLPEAIAAVAGETFGETTVERLINGRVEPEARLLLASARTEAALLDQDRLTTGHVLLAMAGQQSRVSTVLATFGLDPAKISSIIRVAPREEGPSSDGNNTFSDALVRLLLPPHTEGHGGLSVEELFLRIASEPTVISAAIFGGVDATGELLRARLILLRKIETARFKLLIDDLDEIDSALALLDIIPTVDENLTAARVVLLSARPNSLAQRNAAPEIIDEADEVARSARLELGDKRRDARGGLLKELLRTFDRLHDARPEDTAAAIAVLDEVIDLESGSERYDSEHVRAVLNRSIIKTVSGDLKGALSDADLTISLLRSGRHRELRHTLLLARALTHRATVLCQVGRAEEALAAISESLQILMPSLITQDRSWLYFERNNPAKSGDLYKRLSESKRVRPDLSPYKSTLNQVCNALRLDPDPRFLAYLDYFETDVPDQDRLTSLPRLDPPPLRLVTDPQFICEFCAQEPAVAAGVYADIGTHCLRLAQEVFDAEPEEPGRRRSDHERCDLCGRANPPTERVVSSGGKCICLSCVGRAIQLQGDDSSA